MVTREMSSYVHLKYSKKSSLLNVYLVHIVWGDEVETYG